MTVTDAYFHNNGPDGSKNKNVFLSYFIDNNSVTLKGWGLKKNGINGGSSGTFEKDTVPDLTLGVDEIAPGVTIGPNTLVATQVILKDSVNAIRSAVKNISAILYFTPKKVSSVWGNKIIYEIRIKPIDKGANFLDNTYNTNPAPPHQAYD